MSRQREAKRKTPGLPRPIRARHLTPINKPDAYWQSGSQSLPPVFPRCALRSLRSSPGRDGYTLTFLKQLGQWWRTRPFYRTETDWERHTGNMLCILTGRCYTRCLPSSDKLYTEQMSISPRVNQMQRQGLSYGVEPSVRSGKAALLRDTKESKPRH